MTPNMNMDSIQPGVININLYTLIFIIFVGLIFKHSTCRSLSLDSSMRGSPNLESFVAVDIAEICPPPTTGLILSPIEGEVSNFFEARYSLTCPIFRIRSQIRILKIFYSKPLSHYQGSCESQDLLPLSTLL